MDQLGFLNFDLPSELPNAVSVLIVAVPTPQMRIVFNWEGRSVPVIIPPAYVSYTRRTTSVQKTLAERIAKEGYHPSLPEFSNGPQKQIPARFATFTIVGYR